MANTSRKGGKDIQELENAFEKLSGKSVSQKQAVKAPVVNILISAICILAVAAIVCGIIIFTMVGGNSSVKANISIMGIGLKGMSRNEVVETISNEFNRLYGAGPLILQIDGEEISLDPKQAGLTLDSQAAADAAIRYRQPGAKTVALDISEYISVNDSALEAIVAEAALSVNSELTQSYYEITGIAPESLDKIDEKASQVLSVTLGTPGKKLDHTLVLTAIRTACSNGQTEITCQCPFSEPDPLDLQSIFAEHCAAATEAQFEEGTFKVLGGTLGYGFSIEEVSAMLATAEYGQTMAFPFQWTEPETTVEKLTEQLFKDELGAYSATQYSNWNRQENMRIACETIHNTILYPGDVFSFNAAIGPRTPDKGYQLGATYMGNKTVMEYGGGICQVSSSLYYCSILADLEIVERDCHTFAPTYVPLSGDATVYWGGIDYKFKNNTEYPIRIEAIADGDTVHLKLMGTDTKDYYVKFESVHLNTYGFKDVYTEMTSDNEEGYKDGDIITTPYTGYRSEGWKVMYSKETDEEISRTKISTDLYHTRDREIAKIVDPEEPTEPEPTEPAPTEPQPTEPEPTDPPTEPQPTEPQPTDPPPTQGGSSGPIELPPIAG